MESDKLAWTYLKKTWDRIVMESSSTSSPPSLSSAIQQILHPDPILQKPLERLRAIRIQDRETEELLPTIQYENEQWKPMDLIRSLGYLLNVILDRKPTRNQIKGLLSEVKHTLKHVLFFHDCNIFFTFTFTFISIRSITSNYLLDFTFSPHMKLSFWWVKYSITVQVSIYLLLSIVFFISSFVY